MNWWEQALGQMLGAGMGQAGEMVDYQQRAYGAGYLSTFSTDGSCNTLYIDDTEVEEVKLKVEEPPDEFTQLSNHKFHELLDRFNKTI